MASGALSNCSISESGSINGVPGDSTGREYYLTTSWSKAFTRLYRYPDGRARSMISSLAVQAAQNNHIGYGQSDRTTFWNQVQRVGYRPSAIQANCNADCSSSTACILKCAGHLLGDSRLQGVSASMTTSSANGELTGHGFQRIDKTFSGPSGEMMPGDILWRSGHMAIWTDGSPDSSSGGGGGYSSDYEASGSWSSGGGGGWGGGGGGETTVELFVQDIYNERNTRNDAIIREVAYMGGSLEPSISATDLRFSVMNYTIFVGAIWSVFANKYGYTFTIPLKTGGDDFLAPGTNDSQSSPGSASGSSGEGTPGPPMSSSSVARTIISTLMGKGFNYAAAVGVCANCYHESSYNPAAVGDHGTSFGLFQWHAGRGTNMKNFVGGNWSSNVSGQLEFLWQELHSSYGGVLRHLQGVANTVAGAQDAARYWCINWEVPTDRYNKANQRASTAARVWSTYIGLK